MSEDDAAQRAAEILAEERARNESIGNEEAARVERQRTLNEAARRRRNKDKDDD